MPFAKRANQHLEQPGPFYGTKKIAPTKKAGAM
jgi:hypothetical protein